jgi:site-specific DNA recombinase
VTYAQAKEVLARLGLRLPDNIPPGAVIEIAIAYVRVSSSGQLGRGGDKDGDGYSIPAQVQLSEKEAGNLKVRLAKVYIERAESAKSDDRPTLQQMLTEIPIIKELPMVNLKYLIIPKVDRLARNRLDDALLCQKLIGWNIKLASATENIDETPSGQLMHGMLAVFAEYYSNNLATEVMKGLRRKHEMGGTPCKPPIGYLSKRELIGGKDIRTVIVDEQRAPLIQEAFDLYATGEWSLHRLAKHLKAKGLRSRGTERYPERPLAFGTIHQILRNSYYKGVVVWNGQRYPGIHERLVDPDTFDRVQGLLAAARVSGERPQKHEHYLRGTVVCEKCFGRLLFGRHRSHTGKQYEYFCCINRDARRRQTKCESGHYAVDQVELEVMEDVYRTLELPETVKDQVRKELRDELSERTALIQREAEGHERRLKEIEAKQEKLLQLYYRSDPLITDDVFAVEQKKFEDERQAAERLRTVATAQLTDVEEALEIALSRIDRVYETYLDGTELERRVLNRAIFVHIEVGPDGITSTKLTPTYEALKAWHRSLGQPKRRPACSAQVRPSYTGVHEMLIKTVDANL